MLFIKSCGTCFKCSQNITRILKKESGVIDQNVVKCDPNVE